MGDLIDLVAYKRQKQEQEEADRRQKEQAELKQTLDEMEMIKRILSDIAEELPDVESSSIMYVPITPKVDAFMSKDWDDYLVIPELKLGISEDDDRDET